jgi:hypothetical protein
MHGFGSRFPAVDAPDSQSVPRIGGEAHADADRLVHTPSFPAKPLLFAAFCVHIKK